jgi:hypothetical protein
MPVTPLPNWIPQEIDSVAGCYPELIACPVRSHADRCSLRVGELVKIIVRTDDRDGA